MQVNGPLSAAAHGRVDPFAELDRLFYIIIEIKRLITIAAGGSDPV
jgi:hypothetical protein